MQRLLLLLLCAQLLFAQPDRRPAPEPYAAPNLATLAPEDGLREIIDRYTADHTSLTRFYDVSLSSESAEKLRQFYTTWLAAIERMDFPKLGQQSRIDWLLFRADLKAELHQIDLQQARIAESARLLPFLPAIAALKEARQRVEPLDPVKAASTLVAIDKQIEELLQWISKPGAEEPSKSIPKSVAARASGLTAELREILKQWFDFYNGYDPTFSWWMADPYKKLDQRMEKYAAALREQLAGAKDKDTIVGDPVGRPALLSYLASNLIPYTPEQLIAIANREFAWCDAEMLKASRELGYGDDWKAALEHVKTLHVPPGDQPKLILQQALEAIDFVSRNNLITVPPLARDTWRMNMMSPERQRVNPFFTGGQVISVSFPTGTMSHEQKLMSMRGNNIHFSRATVHHEVIPGHFLQSFMRQRYRPYRSLFQTPFWGEGWSLYWELLLWDLGFPKTPENKIGMLFWRMHRCARIIFSLSFHTGKMTAGESVDFLVNRVGHERENAAAEVRRSFETAYEPLYQAAYLLGGLQFRALHRELVASGKMTNRDFHDTILKLNAMPVELVRASLTAQPLTRDFVSTWKFYGDLP